MRSSNTWVKLSQQPSNFSLVCKLITLSDFMTLDAATRRNLELTETIRGGENTGSLLHVLDHTVTPMGKRLLRQWVSKPLLDIPTIQVRQNAVHYLVESGLIRAELRAALRGLADLERLISRVISGHALPRELTARHRSTFQTLPKILALFPQIPPALQGQISRLHPCTDELNFLTDAIER